MLADPLTAAPDPASAARIASSGLRMVRVDPEDSAALRQWYEADARGFLDLAGSDAAFEEIRPGHGTRRTLGVYDDGIPDASMPVATITSWRAPLVLPGGSTVDSWAISAVTVAPTHRRRGVARAMLEGELRVAAAAGLPLAVLTVSEATLYGRYGFGPATWITELVVDTRTAGWRGGETPGRVHLVSRPTMLDGFADIATRALPRAVGSIVTDGLLATRVFGRPSDETDLRKRRFLRYDDADGVPQGYAVYRAEENVEDFASSSIDLDVLVAATDEADAALWRFVLGMDLIATVRAHLRRVDEPLRWRVADPRAIRTAELRDHLWVRVLDVPGALEARGWRGPGELVLEVRDPLGFADGRWRLRVDTGGRAEVSPAPADAPDVVLDVDVLGSLLLGGASATAIAAAGRLAGSVDAIDALDELARTATAPWLGFWF